MKEPALTGARAGIASVIVAVIVWLLPEPLERLRKALGMEVPPVPVKVVEMPPINVTVQLPQPNQPPQTTPSERRPVKVQPKPEVHSLTGFLNPQLHAMKAGSWPWAVIVYGESQSDDIAGATVELLRQRQRGTVRLFRDASAENRFAPDLFSGSPSLAADLQLARYCARLLVGRLKTKVTDSEGTLIGEAAVVFRLLTPDGQVVSINEITAKAGGRTAQDARENAVAELRTSMAAQMSGLLE